MATAFNCTVNVYKQTKLVKGGTGVLFLSGSSAVGALGGFLQRTYSSYSYSRENRNAIQIGAPIADVEGSNYVAFQNASHGGHWYFGFIDHLVYINDNNTEIQFTIDPFPTYLGETRWNKYVYVVRNTPVTDTAGEWLENDYMVKRAGNRWQTTAGADFSVTLSDTALYLVCGQIHGTPMQLGSNTLPVQVAKNPTVPDVQSMLQDGANILGGYLLPTIPADYTQFPFNPIQPKTNMVLNVPSGTYNHAKLNSGVYKKISLTTTQGVKFYDLEDFTNTSTITFGVTFLSLPTPSILIYPKSYKGLANNLAEGLSMQFPAIPIATPSVYTQGQAIGDMFNIASSAITGAAMGFMHGGGYGAIAGVALGAVSGIAGMAVKNETAKYQPTGVTQTNFPLVNADLTLKARLDVCSPDLATLSKIDKYMDYYGYNIEQVMDSADVNVNDGAYLQTGEGCLAGSEGDDAINARLMSGIKIIKSFT